jgi:hypothetical protein
VSFDRESFATLPRGFQRRLLEDAIGRIRDRSGGIDAALDGLAAGVRPGARFAIAGGIEISIGADDVRIRGRSTEGPHE